MTCLSSQIKGKQLKTSITLSLNNVSDILDYLYLNYYSSKGYSSQTSSHWKKFGDLQSLEKVDGQYCLSGGGFGAFIPASAFSKIRNIPTALYLHKMLAGCNQEHVKIAKHIAKSSRRIFSYDMARMLKTIQLLNEHIGDLDGKTIAIIGDGYGTLGSLIKSIFPASRIIYINLGRTLAFDAFYTGLVLPSVSHSLLPDANITNNNSDFTYIEAEVVFKSSVSADIFINIASMQEMDPDITRKYFEMIRQQHSGTYFYCCNRVEKALPDGTVTRFFDYGWQDDDTLLVDELCPWHQEAPMNHPPFKYLFDGPSHHRLAQFK